MLPQLSQFQEKWPFRAQNGPKLVFHSFISVLSSVVNHFVREAFVAHGFESCAKFVSRC